MTSIAAHTQNFCKMDVIPLEDRKRAVREVEKVIADFKKNNIDFASIDYNMDSIKLELLKARAKHAPAATPHHSWGLIEEEMDELKEAIRANDEANIRLEAIQVGAMILSLVAEVLPESGARK